ncbi:GGDEF domain-containing protein [Candidatus Fermentibacteria bacterium]|nr:GGDEF domain-containing protein [Candidatus Fermentibacteria bacterium]
MKAFRFVLSALGVALLAAVSLRVTAPGGLPVWAAWACSGLLTAGVLAIVVLTPRRTAAGLWILTSGMVSAAASLVGGMGGPLSPLYFAYLVWLAHPLTGGPASEAGLLMGVAEAVALASVGGWSVDEMLSRGLDAFATMLAFPVFGLVCEAMLERLGKSLRESREKPRERSCEAHGEPQDGFRRLVEECSASSGVAGAIHTITAWVHGLSEGLTVTTALMGSTGDCLEIYESMGPLSEGRTGRSVPMGESVAAWVVSSGRAARRSGLQDGDRPVQTIGPATAPGASSCAAAPVVTSGRTVGVVLVESQDEGGVEPGVESALLSAAALLGLTLEKLLLEERRRSQTGRDGLTGLPTLTDLMEHLRHAAREVQRFGKSVSVLVASIDGLDRINEDLGFRSGDLALKRFASGLRAVLGEGVMLARIGGNRFAACLPGADRAAAEAMAECITRTFSRQPFRIGDRETAFTVSVGGACTRTDRKLKSLPAEAGRALDAARTAGPGSFRVVELTPIQAGAQK